MSATGCRMRSIHKTIISSTPWLQGLLVRKMRSPLVCQLLSLPLTPNMRSIPIPGFRQFVYLARNS